MLKIGVINFGILEYLANVPLSFFFSKEVSFVVFIHSFRASLAAL
jgi:hypothetical protein